MRVFVKAPNVCVKVKNRVPLSVIRPYAMMGTSPLLMDAIALHINCGENGVVGVMSNSRV